MMARASMKPFTFQFMPLRHRKRARWAAILLLAYTVIGFLILPPIIKAVAKSQLSKQLDREVSISQVRLNPFTFSVTIRGLLIKDPDGEAFVSWDEVYVNFQLRSFLGRAWVFREIRTMKPYVRAQMNKDYTFNFSDLITKFSTNTAPKEPSKPLALKIRKLHIAGASASFTDLTPRTPFKRIIGPLDVTLENFYTDPSNKNPYAFSGTTDAGERFSWSGYFYLDPIRSRGDLSLENLALNKYAPLYQDLFQFAIADGVISVKGTYDFELSATNRVASVTNTSFALRWFKLLESTNGPSIVELPDFWVTGASVDTVATRAEVVSINGSGAKLAVKRGANQAINVLEAAQAPADAKASGGILLLLQSVTNAVSLLLNSTNAWVARVHDVQFKDCAISLEDLANARPVHLDLDQIHFSAKNISNLPDTNLTAELSVRWNTNGTIRTTLEASLLPPTADIHLALDNLELRPLDPYLDSALNVFITGSKLGMEGDIRLRTTNTLLPEVGFRGDVWLNEFATVDGVLTEDLLKWGSIRVSGIDANLNPPTVAVQRVEVNDVYARLIIETNRTINLLAALRADTNAPAVEVPVAAPGTNSAAASLPFESISVGTVAISNAQLRFTDRSMTPNVNMTIEQVNGSVSGLSSAEPQRADVKLQARVDDIGPVEIVGAINPFRDDQTNEIKISVSNVDLTPTSPYAGRFAGYQIAKGKLGMQLAYHIKGRALKSQNVITLDQFTFGGKVDSPEATKLPVRLAIAILKDRNGKIELDVPIEGTLDDPEFRLRKVITRTLVNVITKIVSSPFAALGSLFGGRGEEMSYQEFAPGGTELSAASREKLDALVNGLYERPGLQLEIEGSIDPKADLSGLRRANLEKQIRTRKWMSLRKSARDTTTPEQVTYTPEERLDLIASLYAEASAKGQLIMPPPADTNAPATSAPAAAAAARPSREVERGATALIQGPDPVLEALAASSLGNDYSDITNPKELALLTSLPITDGDFQALAVERAKVVREYILASGKVEADRLFLTETQPGGVKLQGSRVYLQFR